MSCCNNYLGKFPHNQDIDTGIIANATGEFIFKFDYLGVVFRLIIDGQIDESLIIPAGRLNENFTYHFTIEDPSGNNIEIYDCEDFTLKTIVNITPCNDDCIIDVYQ